MARLAFIAPYQQLGMLAAEVAAELGQELDVRVGSMSQGVKLARQAQAEGAQVLISRGWTGADIARAGLDLPVVELRLGALDLLAAWKLARQYGGRIGLADDEPLVRMFRELQEWLDLPAATVPIAGAAHMERALSQLKEQGIDVVIGKVALVQTAERYGMRGVVMASGREAVRDALLTAIHVLSVRRAEQERGGFWRAVLDVTGHGLIAVDGAGRISACNSAAARLLGMAETAVVGSPVVSVLPGLEAASLLRPGSVRREELVEVGTVRVLVDIHPVVVEGQTTGAVCSLQEVTGIERLERSIRQKLAARGHVARLTFADVVGCSPAVKAAVAAARRYALAGAPVLLQGETGTGKEIFAQSIHAAGPRAGGPFVAINCAAVPESLLESELFGYTEGAFTGARKGGRPGLFELAHGGTIFLDEVSEMPVRIQSRLLRVLQEGEVMRLGDDRIIPVDVRVLSAANRDLRRLVESREFRTDLYYRLSVLKLRLPALRERAEDIPLLAERFLSEAARRYGRTLQGFTGEAMAALSGYPWPGNIRELRNTVERLVILTDVPRVDLAAVQACLEQCGSVDAEAGPVPCDPAAIHQAVAYAGGNKSRAARHLGISRTTLWRRLREGADSTPLQ